MTATEKPFTWPTLPAIPFQGGPEGARELEQDPEKLAACRDYTFAEGVLKKAQALDESLSKDDGLSDKGRERQRNAALKEDFADLTAREKRLAETVQRIEGQLTTGSVQTPDAATMTELRSIGQGYARLSPADQQRARDAARLGRDPKLLAALAHLHPAEIGMSPELQSQFRALVEQESTANSGHESIVTKRDQLVSVRRALGVVRGALESRMDREELRKLGLVPPRRSEMGSDKEKSDWISANGREAWERLDP